MGQDEGDPSVSVEAMSADWRGAVILLRQSLGGPRWMRRAAVFLYDLPGGGFAWIEPQAWDSFGASSPALHARPRAVWSPFGRVAGFGYDDPEVGEQGLVYPWIPEELPAVPELEAFYRAAEKEGLDLKAERDRVRPALSGAAGA